MSLQLDDYPSLHIVSIAFSSFKKDLVQKSTIHATLFKDFIELHSTEDDTFYLIKKIKADEDYHFSRGNSGAPIICKKTGDAIAMLSNKEGSDIAYAVGVSCIKRLLEQLHANDTLIQKHGKFYREMSSFKKEVSATVQTRKNPKNRAIFHISELRKEKATLMSLFKEKLLKIKL
jgi:thymidine phosphorylase